MLDIDLVANESGMATITVVVEDSIGDKVSESFMLTVNSVNDRPFVIIPIPDTTVNASYVLKVHLSPILGEVFGDTDSDNITFQIMEEGTDILPNWATFINDTLVCQPTIADTGCVSPLLTTSVFY